MFQILKKTYNNTKIAKSQKQGSGGEVGGLRNYFTDMYGPLSFGLVWITLCCSMCLNATLNTTQKNKARILKSECNNCVISMLVVVYMN